MDRIDPFLFPHWFTHKKIKLPEAGRTFNDATPEDFYLRVERLGEMGYRIPDYVLKEIEEEIRQRRKDK